MYETIPLTINEEQRDKNVRQCAERGVLLPTFGQMKEPSAAPDDIQQELKSIGLWDVHPRNLFRITWANAPAETGGGYGDVNYMVLPPELTGVRAKIIALVGKWFPTGAHKVGATYGCLAPSLVTGQFDSTSMKAVWPSTGNYCRGGAYVASLLACDSIAILPEEMSSERFEWLSQVAGEVIATPGCESNVKEIFDKCWELKKTRDDILIFNQFDEFGNHLWHYEVTGDALQKVLAREMGQGEYYSGVVLSSGSAGTLGCGDKMKKLYPDSKIVVSEALQCPTLLRNGFGGHRIEGIGDKHVPWIHNVKNSDMVIAVDDEHTIRMMRLFNEAAGREYLVSRGVDEKLAGELDRLGISSIGNLVTAIKYAKYWELTEDDIILTVFTDSMELYGSRIKELRKERGEYTRESAVADYECVRQLGIDHTLELSYYEKQRIHNLKYYTWIEQQDRSLDELNAQWYDARGYWGSIHEMAPKIDEKIEEFNRDILAAQ